MRIPESWVAVGIKWEWHAREPLHVQLNSLLWLKSGLEIGPQVMDILSSDTANKNGCLRLSLFGKASSRNLDCLSSRINHPFRRIKEDLLAHARCHWLDDVDVLLEFFDVGELLDLLTNWQPLLDESTLTFLPHFSHLLHSTKSDSHLFAIIFHRSMPPLLELKRAVQHKLLACGFAEGLGPFGFTRIFLHLEVLVAFRSTKTKRLAIIANKLNAMAWVAGATAEPTLLKTHSSTCPWLSREINNWFYCLFSFLFWSNNFNDKAMNLCPKYKISYFNPLRNRSSRRSSLYLFVASLLCPYGTCIIAFILQARKSETEVWPGSLNLVHGGYCTEPPLGVLVFCSFVNFKVWFLQWKKVND